MSYRAGKIRSNGRAHSPGHSPRVSASKLALPRARPLWRTALTAAPVSTASTTNAASAERPVIDSRPCAELPPLNQCDLVTQVYAGQQDLPVHEYTSYFNGRTCDNVPSSLTSHKASGSRLSSTFPFFSTYQQSVTWDTTQLRITDHDYDSRCIDSQSSRCPETISRHSCDPTDDINFRFKNNIMTFCDQHTMTSKVNDVSCGICLGVGYLETKHKGIETSRAAEKPDNGRTSPITRRKTCNISPEPSCFRKPCNVPPEPACSRFVPPLTKRVRHHKPKRGRRRTAVFQDCGTHGYGCQEAAVRDTDPMMDCCYEPLEENDNCRYPPIEVEIDENCSRHCHDQLGSRPFCGRKTLYNEGISDDIANNLPFRVRQRCPSAQRLFKPSSNCSMGIDNWIPYSHRGSSRYHSECKKPPEVQYRGDCAPGDCHLPPEYFHHRPGKKCVSKRPDTCVYSYSTQLPRKLLTSEKNIDSYIMSKAHYDDGGYGCDN
ncbi:hypothetical protein O0L34_g11681 [Tuta absoluta]|nr:hypothetical protein O0L34_g11681 [Tuta absoluta]